MRNNWGDLLNSELIFHLARQPVVNEADVMGWGSRPVYRVIGSGLAKAKSNHIIWGMGFIDKSSVPRHRPALVCAVRGPLSRKRLLDLDISCPEVYGDPAILYPLFYDPKVQKVHDFGIIQHFREVKKIPPPLGPKGSSCTHIDICSGIQGVVDQVKACRAIISSSLHGIVCAHAYGIPAYWLKASDLPLGDDFKFHDYYASIGHDHVQPATVGEDGIVDLQNSSPLPAASRIRFADLVKSCPFIDSERRATIFRAFKRKKEAGAAGTIFS